jgi:septation ring formation regulator EzrA
VLTATNKNNHDLFTKFTDATKLDLDSIKASQEFISSKFDELNNTVDKLKFANHDISSQNEQLKERIAKLETNALALDSDMEHLKEYIRRDMLEIYVVPVSSSENSNYIFC